MENVKTQLKAAGYHLTLESELFVGAITEVDGRYMSLTIAQNPVTQRFYAVAKTLRNKDLAEVTGFETADEAYAALLTKTPEGTIEALTALCGVEA